MFPPKPEEHKFIPESMDEVKELLCRLLGRLIEDVKSCQTAQLAIVVSAITDVARTLDDMTR